MRKFKTCPYFALLILLLDLAIGYSEQLIISYTYHLQQSWGRPVVSTTREITINQERKMAVTHADVAPSRRRRGMSSADLGSKTGALLMVVSILFGLFCFVLCLIAEATRSQIIWAATGSSGEEETYECRYSGSGKTPLISAAGAFLALAVAMLVEHTYMLIVVSKSAPPALVSWDPDSNDLNTLTWQAGFFFVSTWICFAVGEILLLIGLSIESGHLKNWSSRRPSCLIIRQGIFSAAGVIGLVTVFLASGLYITALRAQWIIQDQENVRREVLEASAIHSSPPRRDGISAVANENPIIRHGLQNAPDLSRYLSAFDKHSSLV